MGQIIHKFSFAITIKMTSVQTNESWLLSNIYGSCDGPERVMFIAWMENINIETEDLWLFMGDFNFMRSLENSNLPGGNVDDVIKFNEIISHLGLLEIPIKGRRYTWSNMQETPLLEQLDWFFLLQNGF